MEGMIITWFTILGAALLFAIFSYLGKPTEEELKIATESEITRHAKEANELKESIRFQEEQIVYVTECIEQAVNHKLRLDAMTEQEFYYFRLNYRHNETVTREDLNYAWEEVSLDNAKGILLKLKVDYANLTKQ